MMTIATHISVADAMDKILAERYAAESQGNYKKYVRIQIRNTAMQDEGFVKAFENEVGYNFSSLPDLDEIDELISDLPYSLEELLNQYDIIKTAKQFAKEDLTWCGHEMTLKQKELCETVWVSVSSWFKAVPKGCDISVNLEQAYEHKTGKSCVNWHDPDNDDWDWCHDTLPRPKNYETNGYTDAFNDWAADKIVKAVVEAGCETHKEVADYIRKICPVVRG